MDNEDKNWIGGTYSPNLFYKHDNFDKNNYISSYINRPSTLTICNGGGTIVIGEDITWTGYENASEAALAFLNALKECYPNWIPKK